MQRYYDITNPDAAYEWLYSVLDMKRRDFISDYVLESRNDSDTFFERHLKEAERLDIDQLELMAIHVTTNGDGCAEIKKNGLRDLKKVLQEKSELSTFLREKNIWFDIPSKTMYVNGKAFDIDYQKYTNLDRADRKNQALYKIGHRIFYDHQVNGFLFSKDVYDYGTIHEAPEFLLTLSEFDRDTVGINDEWAAASKPYVIKYRAKITEFEYYTFYEGQEDYLQDYHNGWIGLKKILFQKAVRSAFSELSSDVYAYMKPERIIEPARIIECIPAEEWQDRISKYF